MPAFKLLLMNASTTTNTNANNNNDTTDMAKDMIKLIPKNKVELKLLLDTRKNSTYHPYFIPGHYSILLIITNS